MDGDRYITCKGIENGKCCEVSNRNRAKRTIYIRTLLVKDFFRHVEGRLQLTLKGENLRRGPFSGYAF